jgi:hypothetical protein
MGIAAALVALLLDTGRLADAVTQVVELRSANVALPLDIDRLNDRGVQREDPLNADTEADLADGERCARTRSTAACDHNTFECLNAFASGLDDSYIDHDSVSWTEVRDVVAQLRILDLLDRIHGVLRSEKVR